QVAESHSRLDAAGEVGRLVLEQPGHPFGRKGNLVAPWWSAQAHLRPTAPDDDGGRDLVAGMQVAGGIIGIVRAHRGRRQQTVHAEPALLLDVDLLPGERLLTRLHPHTSSPAARAGRDCRRGYPSGIGRGACPRPPGNTFPGFIRRCGSKTRRTRSITSRSSSEKT